MQKSHVMMRKNWNYDIEDRRKEVGECYRNGIQKRR